MEILGIDIGGTGIKGAPVNTETGELIGERLRIPTPQPATPDAVVGVVNEIAQHFSWKGAIGCTFPARIKRGIARTAANVDRSWLGTNVENLIEKETGCATVVLNDADAAGVAELAFGAGRDRQGMVLLLTFGTGIGSALFMDQQLVPNTEFGHIEMHRGPAEHYAADSARKKNDLKWSEWAIRVQEYLDRIEFLLAPDLIIIGGGVSKPNKKIKYFGELRTDADLVTAQLQNNAGIIGGAFRAGQLLVTSQ
ncbi:MAG: polyphosphate--glucose phosphotransferase [Rhodothermales bacterium]